MVLQALCPSSNCLYTKSKSTMLRPLKGDFDTNYPRGDSIVRNTGGAGSIVWGLGFWFGEDILGFFKNIDLDNSQRVVK